MDGADVEKLWIVGINVDLDFIDFRLNWNFAPILCTCAEEAKRWEGC
jgi:hypothetical protein